MRYESSQGVLSLWVLFSDARSCDVWLERQPVLTAACTHSHVYVYMHVFTGSFVQFNMAAYHDREGVQSFVGAAPGYQGQAPMRKVFEEHPDAVVLLDEFEKGHCDGIPQLLLKMLEKDGRVPGVCVCACACASSRCFRDTCLLRCFPPLRRCRVWPAPCCVRAHRWWALYCRKSLVFDAAFRPHWTVSL